MDTIPTGPVEKFWRQLVASIDSDPHRAFRTYCERVIELRSNGLSIEHAAYYIAGAMFIDEVDDDDQLQEVTQLAGLLEVPPKTHGEKVAHEREWRRLVRLVVAIKPKRVVSSK